MIDRIRWVTIVWIICGAASASAQMMGSPHGRFMGPPPFLQQVFPPELIMRNQDTIGLTGKQREAITQTMADAQTKLVDLQWQFEGESEKLNTLLAAATVEETAALAQAEKVMNLELQIKKTHLSLLIHIKNLLTASQQTKLRELRPASRPMGTGQELEH